ncbi:maleylpyruvate isomerase N-terminal domain-containing protein [Catellatospora vulcania]|uniref:maleylpyruvate isomerase N-terminal domain-containing protein n=1 Tax=Catellatospora vulcania TaxID=1460450 RepID=UPI0012D3E89C|nr:maleylpyruvate isomerase N-terminal domain-containing protein [Catellatospora vulcania]
MSAVREAYLQAALSAAALVGDPAVASAWAKPSALDGFTVAGLAGHLAAQVVNVPRVLRAPAPDGPPVALADHYGRVRWLGADLDAEVNVQIRQGGEALAEAGPRELVAQTGLAVAELRSLLAEEPADRLVSPPAGPWAMLLDDFLVTRLMEITVHSDDLAYSVGVPTPDQPRDVLDPVLALLGELAVRRHGQAAVIRALSRAERAPASITAF